MQTIRSANNGSIVEITSKEKMKKIAIDVLSLTDTLKKAELVREDDITYLKICYDSKVMGNNKTARIRYMKDRYALL